MDITGLVIDKLGLGAGLVFGFLVILWMVTKYSARRLFDEHTGIVTLVANEHVEVMKSIKETQTKQHLEIVGVKETLEIIEEMQKDQSSIKKLHESGLIACDILEDISHRLDDLDITDNLRKIRVILSRDNG